MITKKLMNNLWLQCLLFLIGGGLVSMALKFEMTWDFAQYHYHNGWSFAEGRFNYDLLAAGYNGYYNPLMDLPLYYLIKYFNDYPNLIYFAQGLWFGALGFVLFKISGLFFSRKAARFFTVLLGLCGYGVFFQIGSSSNEIMISFLLLLSLYLLLRILTGLSEARGKLFFLAGLIAGSAMGLKLTAVIYCVSLGAALILFAKKISSPLKNIMLFALGGLLGFAAFGGYWLWQCWSAFQNPFFPFANEIFQSSYWNGGNYTDDRFVPQNWKEFLLLPFNTHRGEGFTVMVDFRLALLYLVLLVSGGKYLLQKVRKEEIIWNIPLMFIGAFMFFSYLIWINYFGIARYMLPVEILCGLVLVKAAVDFMPEKGWKYDIYVQFLSAMVILLLLNPLFSENSGCRNCEQDGRRFSKFVEVKNVRLPDNSLILFYRSPFNYPVSALLTHWAQESKNLRGTEATPRNYQEGFFAGGWWKEQRDDILKNHTGTKVAVLAVNNPAEAENLRRTEPVLRKFECRELETNLTMAYYTYFLCVDPQNLKKIFTSD